MAGFPCALCLGRDAETEEHIIPRSIGGGLALPILCKPCNDALGHGIDADALKSRAIQGAALRLKGGAPWLWLSIGPDVEVKALAADVPLQVEKETGEPQVEPHLDPDTGALQLPQTPLGQRMLRKHLAAMIRKMRRKGQPLNVDVERAATDFTNAEPGDLVDVPSLGVQFAQQQNKGVQYVLGPPLDPRYAARIGYLTLIAAGGRPKDAHLESWRRFVRGEITGDRFKAGVLLGSLPAPSTDPMLGHYVEAVRGPGNMHIVDIVLFGWSAWRCAFLLERPAVLPFVAYGVDLQAGTAAVSVDEAEWKKGMGVTVPAPDPRVGWRRRR